ncbi:hypothetical protein OBBRIDRAFT_439117 [Obba rivulosa]|uniref:Uncharacterized protein n=1 Tax=Obba rivulosa TaxID=1052685 RepID=A0A8E2ALB9_9APHY|nr:hypothetical protein OBBRIDRAFT_439117 [Obba rivulosa]
MPRDLPGLYWDEDKQRYFSIASRPGAAAATEPRSPAPAAKRKRPLRYERTEHNEEGIPFHQWRRRSPMWAAAENLARSTSTASRSRIKHEVLCSNVMFASNDLGFHLNHPISSFSVNKDTESRDEQFLVSIGDNQGWLHSVEIDSSNFSHRRDLGLLSEVSSVCHWKTRLIAVSFGTPCKLVVGRAHNHEYDAWQLLHLPEHVYDVRTAHLYGSRLVLGAARKGVLIPDLDASVRTVNLGTDNSDVLAVHQQEHLIYVGARSGAIGRFDCFIWTSCASGSYLSAQWTAI